MFTRYCAALVLIAAPAFCAEIDEAEVERFITALFTEQNIKNAQAFVDAKQAKPSRGIATAALVEHWIKELKESKLKFTLKPKRLFKSDEQAAIVKELNVRNGTEPAFKELLTGGLGVAVVMQYENAGRKRERASLFVFRTDAEGKTRLVYVTD